MKENLPKTFCKIGRGTFVPTSTRMVGPMSNMNTDLESSLRKNGKLINTRKKNSDKKKPLTFQQTIATTVADICSRLSRSLP